MTIKELKWYKFDKPITENTTIMCPECCVYTHISKWEETEIYGCELCGSHPAIVCSNCDEKFDHTDHEIFKTI